MYKHMCFYKAWLGRKEALIHVLSFQRYTALRLIKPARAGFSLLMRPLGHQIAVFEMMVCLQKMGFL